MRFILFGVRVLFYSPGWPQLIGETLPWLPRAGMSVQHLAQHLALLRRMDSISLWRAPLFLGREEESAGPSMVSLFRVWQCVL